MLQALLSTLSTVVQALSSSDFCSMDLNAINNAFNNNLNTQMQAQLQGIIQSNMSNPEIQQQYQVYLRQGGTLNFPSYCQRYAETGGFTQAGFQNAISSQSQIHAQDMANRNAYFHHSQQVRQETYDYRNEVQDQWAKQRGETLSAQAPFVNSQDGSTWHLPTNASPGEVFHDTASGNQFVMDVHGQYLMSNGQGWWQSMDYKR